MHHINIRLRDFFITADDWIFAVSGYDSTDGVQAVLRYIPDKSGDRELDGVRYRKLDFDEAFRFVEEMRPSWKDLCVPEDEILQVFRADKRTQSLAKEDRRVAAIVNLLEAALQGMRLCKRCGMCRRTWITTCRSPESPGSAMSCGTGYTQREYPKYRLTSL
jgi:predicted nucleotidyltransferase